VFAALPPCRGLCCDRAVTDSPANEPCALGLDSGGTATRWRRAGRVPMLDERILTALRDALAPGTAVTLAQPDGALAAAHLALGRLPARQNS
jgi:hypothetical protein